MIRAGVILSAAVLLGGCAHPSLFLLPDEDGGQGSVALLEANGKPSQGVISDPNSRTALGRQAAVTRPLGRKGLKPRQAGLLGDLPPPARSFTLYFDEGEVELSVQSLGDVGALRTEIAKRSGAEVEVTGHTDTVGSDEDNDALSLKRAQEVLALLVVAGFDPALMSATGRGERELRQPTADGVANAINRRVEVIVR